MDRTERCRDEACETGSEAQGVPTATALPRPTAVFLRLLAELPEIQVLCALSLLAVSNLRVEPFKLLSMEVG